MRLCARLARVAVLVLALYTAAPAAAQIASTPSHIFIPMANVSKGTTVEQQVVALINQQRQQNGCQVMLILSPQLSESALAHSSDMAINNIFSHTGSDGSTLTSRIEATGYQYSIIAENIAAGFATPQEVVEQWMLSQHHRDNILNCELRETGIGFYDQPNDQANVHSDGDAKLRGPYRYYWTQDFGAP